MKCRIKKTNDNNITNSTFTVYNQDGTVLKENATFDEIYSKENFIKLILSATSLPLRAVEN